MYIFVYKRLLKKLGPSHWWPGETPFEVIVGAILTQNTSWKNVEKAIHALKVKKLLSPGNMAKVKESELAQIIKSSGYYNQKARKLIVFLDWFKKHRNSISYINRKYSKKENELRQELLGLYGIGPETADSILCYALKKPFFVVDHYTFRWLHRYRPDRYTKNYEDLRSIVEKEFLKRYPEQPVVHLNEFHALIVRLSSQICTKKNPKCNICPLEGRCVANDIV